MKNCFFVPITACCLLFSYLIAAAPLADVIDSTCKACAERSTVFDYRFCVTTLKANPAGDGSDRQGLALLAMELALGNATSTQSKIQKLLCGKEYDPFAMNCLQDCLELYGDAAETLVNSISALLSRKLDVANVLLSAVMEATTTCEEGFTEKEGEVSPLTKENYNLFQISDIALCSVNLISSK